MAHISWFTTTACDFFISLLALHHPADFGLRPPWTAGVRQRVSPAKRELLERVMTYAIVPLAWISRLPDPRDAETVLECAARLTPEERFAALTLPTDLAADSRQALHDITRNGRWTPAGREVIWRGLSRRNRYLKPSGLDNLMKAWITPQDSGEAYLDVLREYQTVFFAEEEVRIRPALEAGLSRAMELAGQLPVNALVEQLSRGVHFEEVNTVAELVLTPSYWSTPFVFHLAEEGRTMIVFGCRLEDERVAPGAEIPVPMVNGLKALADPTRLRILQYLSSQPLAPSELARRLRLRPPTVIHHLHALRLAGLVTIHVSENGDKRYAARFDAMNDIFTSVQVYLTGVNKNG